MEGNFFRNFSHGRRELVRVSGVSNNRGIKKSGVKVQC